MSAHNPPTISVVIAVYNGERTIARAIQSVLSQTFPAFELIIVDDGSTDATPEKVRGFGEKVVYLRQENAGVSAARNAGVAAASGEWLAFLDADDFYYPERLRWHADWIARDPQLDFLTGDYEYRRPDGTLISRSLEITMAGRVLLRQAQGEREVVLESPQFQAYVSEHFGDTHTLTVRRETFLRLDGYPVSTAVCEDVSFLIRLCAVSKRIGVVCEPMAVYVIHSGSATRSDPLRAQRLTVQALIDLGGALGDAPVPVVMGYRGRLRRARLNLAYALLRRGRRAEAFSVAVKALIDDPGLETSRNLMSIARGLLQRNSGMDNNAT